MGDEPLRLFRWRRAGQVERDSYVLEIGRRIVHIIFLGVTKGRAHVGRSAINGHIIERREPRQLGEQSERYTDHDKLQR